MLPCPVREAEGSPSPGRPESGGGTRQPLSPLRCRSYSGLKKVQPGGQACVMFSLLGL